MKSFLTSFSWLSIGAPAVAISIRALVTYEGGVRASRSLLNTPDSVRANFVFWHNAIGSHRESPVKRCLYKKAVWLLLWCVLLNWTRGSILIDNLVISILGGSLSFVVKCFCYQIKYGICSWQVLRFYLCSLLWWGCRGFFLRLIGELHFSDSIGTAMKRLFNHNTNPMVQVYAEFDSVFYKFIYCLWKLLWIHLVTRLVFST